MKKRIVTILCLVSVVWMVSVSAKADIISGRLDSNYFISNYWHPQGNWNNNTGSGAYYGENKTTGQKDLMFFCLDPQTNVKSGFSSTGINYSIVTSFDDATGGKLTEAKKSAIISLIEHVYKPMMGLETTNNKLFDFYQAAFQEVVWEIIMETQVTVTDNQIVAGLALSNGDWTCTVGGVYGSAIYANNAAGADVALKSLTDQWFSGIMTGAWAAEFAETALYEITYFAASGNASQPFFAITGEAASAATPEPASMLIMGIGLAGAALLRRKRGINKQ